jgi:hypothetical protein
MKFILAFSICSAITGYCNNTATLPTEFKSWSECIGAGGTFIQSFSIEMKESIEDNKLYMNYFCNEVPKENV